MPRATITECHVAPASSLMKGPVCGHPALGVCFHRPAGGQECHASTTGERQRCKARARGCIYEARPLSHESSHVGARTSRVERCRKPWHPDQVVMGRSSEQCEGAREDPRQCTEGRTAGQPGTPRIMHDDENPSPRSTAALCRRYLDDCTLAGIGGQKCSTRNVGFLP